MAQSSTLRRPSVLAWTPDEEAQRLAASNSIAFVIGFLLDQQIKIQVAFNSPLLLKQRLGHLDPAKIATMDTDELVEVFCAKTPLHRYPRSMAIRTQECMRTIVETYDGDVDRVWTEAADLKDLRKRIEGLPGFGKMKAVTVAAVIARQFGMEQQFPGWEEGLPPYGALAYCDTLDDLAEYQRVKGEYKKALKAKKAATGGKS